MNFRPPLLALLWVTASSFGQGAHGFAPGQTIYWRDRVSGKWQSGIYLGATPGDKQPIIQQRSGEPGSQTAYDWDNVRDVNSAAPGEGPATTPAVVPLPLPMVNPKAPQPLSNIPPLPLPAKKTPAQSPAHNSATAGPGGQPLTETDIEGWLAQQLPGNPFADSSRLQQANKDLAELVKQRGTTFTNLDKVEAALNHYGINSTARGPLTHNYGPPNTKEQLFGTWITNKIGLPTHAVEGDYYVTYGEMFAAKTGTVTINSDHSYTWDTQGPQGVIRGRWDDAMPDEMGDQGGAGIILKAAKSGEDWVAYKYRAGTKEEWLGLAEVNRRSIRESAARF